MERHYKIKPLIITKFNLRKGDMVNRLFYGETYWAPNVSWYIEGADRNILIDTSISAEDTKRYTTTKAEDVIYFEDALSLIGLKPEDIDLIIHTHLHFDHCGNTQRKVHTLIKQAQKRYRYSYHRNRALIKQAEKGFSQPNYSNHIFSSCPLFCVTVLSRGFRLF